MKLPRSWFVLDGLPKASFQGFERRRASSLARLSAVTREMRAALEARRPVSRTDKPGRIS